ncbi:MAG TPA: OsmC family protein [Gemmatimonadaceae bacterium]
MSVTREYQAQGKKRVNHIVARWVEDEAFDAGQAMDGQPMVRIDGMRKTGPGPVDMLLSALATCSAIDVVSILAKRRTPLSALDIDVRGERAQAVPARLTSIAIIYRITGEGIDRESAEMAIDLALNKYCSVRDSLDPAIPIEWTLVLNGDSSGARVADVSQGETGTAQ